MLRSDSFSPDVWEAICTPMHEILPRGAKSSGSGALFLGSWTASVDTDLLSHNSIKAIVECHDSPWGTCDSSPPPANPPPFGRSPTSPSFQQGARPPLARASSTMSGTPSGSAGSIGKGGDQYARFKVSVPDSSTPDLLKPHLDGAVRFIEDRLSRGENVLVHCQQVRHVSILTFHQSDYLLSLRLLRLFDAIFSNRAFRAARPSLLLI